MLHTEMDGAKSGMDKLMELVSTSLSEPDPPASFGQLELEFAAPDQRILDGDFLLVNISKVPEPEAADTRGKEQFNSKEAKPETSSAAQDDEEVDEETDDEEVDDETDDEEVDDETDVEEVDDETDDEEELDERGGLEPKDIELVMVQAGVSRSVGYSDYFSDEFESSVSYIPNKYLHQQKEDAWSVGYSDYDSDGFESYIPSTSEEDDASSMSSLNDSHSVDSAFETDDGDLGKQNAAGTIEVYWNPCKLSKDDEEETQEETVDKLQLIMAAAPVIFQDEERYDAEIYGYYRKSQGYGGYGILLYNEAGIPIGAYYGVSKGGSYLYYLLEGIRKCLQIAADQRLPRVEWSINSQRAVDYFNSLFLHPFMLTDFFHSKRNVADINFCKRCLKDHMWLTAESFKLLVPVIEAIIKLQFDSEFKYRQPCTVVRSDAAYYVAKCGAEALEKKMLTGVSSDEQLLEEVEMKMEELPEWLLNGESK